MAWANEYVGIPFEWAAARRDGASCWGLICLVYEDQLGIHLPRHNELSHSLSEGGEVALEAFYGDFQEVPLSEAQPFDLLHMTGPVKINGVVKIKPFHVGVIAERGKVLHSQLGAEACIQDYRRQPLSHRVIGAYRHA